MVLYDLKGISVCLGFRFWLYLIYFYGVCFRRIPQRENFTFIWFVHLDFGTLCFVNSVCNFGYCFFSGGFADGVLMCKTGFLSSKYFFILLDLITYTISCTNLKKSATQIGLSPFYR